MAREFGKADRSMSGRDTMDSHEAAASPLGRGARDRTETAWTSARRRTARLLMLLVLLAPATGWAALQEGQPPPYITTPQQVVERMLALAKVTADDFVIDLGSGDGRIVITAAQRYGARGMGVDITRDLIAKSVQNAEAAGVGARTRFVLQDALLTDLAPASVLTLYLGPELNEKLIPRILSNMRPGTRVISHDFGLGSWQPDAIERFNVPEKNFGRGGESTVMLWIVPANAAGRWRAEFEHPDGRRTEEFSLGQDYQRLDGVLHAAAGGRALAQARLEGARVSFTVAPESGSRDGARAYSGAIAGDTITGSVRIEGRGDVRPVPFTARRIKTRPDLF